MAQREEQLAAQKVCGFKILPPIPQYFWQRLSLFYCFLYGCFFTRRLQTKEWIIFWNKRIKCTSYWLSLLYHTVVNAWKSIVTGEDQSGPTGNGRRSDASSEAGRRLNCSSFYLKAFFNTMQLVIHTLFQNFASLVGIDYKYHFPFLYSLPCNKARPLHSCDNAPDV